MTRAENPLIFRNAPLSPIPTGLKPSGSLHPPAACVLLDVYGTLFISASGDLHSFEIDPAKRETLRVLLERWRVPGTPEILVKQLLTAIQASHTRLKARGVDFPEVRIERLWNSLLRFDEPRRSKAFAAEFESVANPVHPMPRLREFLAGLKDRKILMGILSNAQFYTPALFKKYLGSGLKDLGFRKDLIFFSFQFGWAKPSLFLYEKAEARLRAEGIAAKQVLYVGNDMLNDILPARKVGFKTALFAGDARSLRLRKEDPRCRGVKPDLVVTDLIQILNFV